MLDEEVNKSEKDSAWKVRLLPGNGHTRRDSDMPEAILGANVMDLMLWTTHFNHSGISLFGQS